MLRATCHAIFPSLKNVVCFGDILRGEKYNYKPRASHVSVTCQSVTCQSRVSISANLRCPVADLKSVTKVTSEKSGVSAKWRKCREDLQFNLKTHYDKIVNGDNCHQLSIYADEHLRSLFWA